MQSPNQQPKFTTRQATDGDVPQIFRLLAFYAVRQIVLPRSEADIRYYLGNFTVCMTPEGELAGCVAVRDFGNGLFEVRSLAVKQDYQNMGVGKMLLKAAMESLEKRVKRFKLFALTYQTGFFLAAGFIRVDKTMFPEKIWSDCMLCPKQEHCDEEAVLFDYDAKLA
ncbi:MAG: GNAT family N-acetyltransferase [Victivallaceae bacterium]|nr:GNAT family N-acetyltransferase [Victivallaceae bacterium]